MADPKNPTAATNPPCAPLTSCSLMRRTMANRVFAITYASAILALFYHHLRRLLLLCPATVASAAPTLSLLIADVTLAFMWSTTQSFRMFPVRWQEHPDNLGMVFDGDEDFPALDVFVCTADPYKEPPLGVVNTVLSVMAYEYPPSKVSVYVSDDGGSELTLFAFMEAAKFAREWLPFCRRNKVMMERSPHAYFSSSPCGPEVEKLKVMYERMKVRIENVVEMGKVGDEDDYVDGVNERHVFCKWTDTTFTKQDHPPVVQVLLDNNSDRDNADDPMPNLIYVSREKNKVVPHHFKAGALNVLSLVSMNSTYIKLRVSAVMTNAPIVLTLDCDMRSNDPTTPHRVLCHLFDPSLDRSELGYVQFPQRFQGINNDDIYGGDHKRLFLLNPSGMKNGPSYVGTGCFFRRRSLFGSPTAFLAPEISELSPEYAAKRPMRSPEVAELADRVASCSYEDKTSWGSKIGFRYGSLVEDYYTGYRLQCEGWKSRFCNPDRAAFLGDAPISLIEVLNQTKRWSIGLLEVAFSRYSPVTFGFRSMGPIMGLSYAHYAFWSIWSVPIAIYAFVPQLSLVNGLSIFPKVSEAGFLMYMFLFFGTYAQDLVDFILGGHKGTFRRWWSDQRMWLIRGLTSYLFGMMEFGLESAGIAGHGFNITSKINNDEQAKKYEQGEFEFGASSPMFFLLGTAATVNLVSLVRGLVEVVVNRGRWDFVEGQVLQLLLVGFGVVNSWPIYEAMLLRSDKGKIPTKVTLASVFVASLLSVAASVIS